MKVTVTVGVPDITVRAAVPGASAGLNAPVVKEYVNAPAWQGDYTFTAGDNEQTIVVAGYRMIQDIKIAPVPSNYGKIDWDGSTLTVY